MTFKAHEDTDLYILFDLKAQHRACLEKQSYYKVVHKKRYTLFFWRWYTVKILYKIKKQEKQQKQSFTGNQNGRLSIIIVT